MVSPVDTTRALRIAASHLDSASEHAHVANELPMPRWFRKERATTAIEASFGHAVAQGRLALAQLDGTTGPAHEAIQGVDELLDLLDPALPRDEGRGLAFLRHYSEHRDVATRLSLRADRLRLLAEHLESDPATVRATLDREVAEITTRPYDQIGSTDVRRLAAIDGLPEPYRPELPAGVRAYWDPEELVARRLLPSIALGRPPFNQHRLYRERLELAADPSITRETLDAEVRAIIALPDTKITPEINWRMSLIAGLGDDLRPAIVDARSPWRDGQLHNLAAHGWLPGNHLLARGKYAAMRMAVEQEALLADPAITRESVTKELSDLLAIPDAELTNAQVYRMSLLARLPERLRPPMPARLDSFNFSFENIGLLGYHPVADIRARKVFEHARIHMAAVIDPELTVATLAARVQAGQPIDFRVLAALDGQEALLARHGLTPDVLSREAVRTLSIAGTTSKEGLLHHLRLVRGAVGSTAVADERFAPIRAQALELLDRNIARMEGTRRDTFGSHPDYAEVGRIVSIAELLDATAPKPVTTAATDAASESLTW